MNLSVVVFTINGEETLSRCLPNLQGIGDELVVGVDDTTVDNSAAIARQFTGKVYPVRHEIFCGNNGKDLPTWAEDILMPYCSGDWILRIDHDETLSPLWSNRNYLASLLGDRYATHYWIPRRWLLPPGDRFISSRHWYPDHQLRLYRNIPSLIRYNRLPHEPFVIAGEPRSLTDAWLNHWDFVWHDRRAREAKVAFYQGCSPYSGKDFYLYEDYSFQTKAMDYLPRRRSSGQVGTIGQPFCVSLRLIDAPDQMYAGTRDSVLIEITNRSDRVLYAPSNLVHPGNVSVSYHWFRATDQSAAYKWDGERWNFPGHLKPGESVDYFLNVTTPAEPGDYLLQADLVEERVAWYSAHCPLSYFPVKVIGG